MLHFCVNLLGAERLVRNFAAYTASAFNDSSDKSTGYAQTIFFGHGRAGR